MARADIFANMDYRAEAHAMNQVIADIGNATAEITARNARWQASLDPANPPTDEWAAIVDHQLLLGALVENVGQVAMTLRDTLEKLGRE